MEGNIERRDAEIETLKKRNETLSSNIEILEQRIELLRSSNEALKSGYEILKKNNEALKQDNASLSANNDTLKRNIDRLNSSIEELKQRNDTLEKEIDGLRQSEPAILKEKMNICPETTLNDKLSDEMFRKMGIKNAVEKKRRQIGEVLKQIQAKESLTAGELKQATNIQTETLNRLISKLTEAHLVKRRGGRKYGAYFLTEEGKKLFEA
jgi:predicted transcriptional regulator/cell division protein FtsB